MGGGGATGAYKFIGCVGGTIYIFKCVRFLNLLLDFPTKITC